MEDGASRSPLPSRFLPDRKRKRFLAFARNDDAGRRHSPSFLRKGTPRRRCARNGSPIPTAFSLLPLEGGAPKGRRLAHSGMSRNGKRSFPVSSSRAQPRDLFGRPINGRRDTAGKRNTKTSIFIFTRTWITAGQGRFLDFARNDVTRKPLAANVPFPIILCNESAFP